MRLIALTVALVASASPAFAVQDRYGPPSTESAVRATPIPAGPLLDWTGKAAPTQVAPAPAAPPRPAPIAPWAQRLAPQPPQTQAAPPPPQQQARLLPPPANAPQPFAARIAAPPPPPIPTALAPNATERPRIYSVARQYGEQPDPIPGAAAPRGQALTLSEVPAGANLAQNQAALDAAQADRADIPESRQNAASNRIPRYAP
jgi:hypothetical protein